MPPRISITESFGWLSPEAFDLHSVGKNTIKIKGVALPAGATSKNRRKYVEEELIRAARTLIGKPITINHDPDRIIGNVEWAEHEDGLTEYLATIKKQPYVDMLREHNASILGVSVEADYLHNQCTICGDKFYTEEDFRNHMQEAHLIKNGVTAVHGMNYKALSLVLSPEIPGVSATTVELMETLHKQRGLHPLSQLLETVTIENQEKQVWETKMKDKIVVQPENRSTVDRLKEQAISSEPTLATPDTNLPQPEDVDVSEPTPIADDNIQEPTHPVAPEGQECESGFHFDKVAGTCVADPLPQSTPPQNSPPIGPSIGETDSLKVSPEINPLKSDPPATDLAKPEPLPADNIEPTPHPTSEPGKECGEGSHWDEESCTCVPDLIPAVKEITFTVPLKLGEPFANYKDFDACVAANQDKDDPEAYCASVKAKVEKQPASEMWSPERGYIRDIQLAAKVNEQGKQLQELYSFLSKIREEANKPILTEAKIRAAANTSLKQQLTEVTAKQLTIKKQLKETATKQTNKLTKAHNDTVTFFTDKTKEICNHQTNTSKFFAGELKEISGNIHKLNTNIKNGSTNIQTIQNKLTEIIQSADTLRDQVDNQKKSYETIIAAVDKRYGELKEEIKPLETRIKEQEDELEKRKCETGFHYSEEEGKCVPDTPPEQAEETKKLTETVDKLSVQVDNLGAKLKGDFKAQSQPLKKTAKNPPIKDKMRTGN